MIYRGLRREGGDCEEREREQGYIYVEKGGGCKEDGRSNEEGMRLPC